MDYYPETFEEYREFLSAGPWHLPWFFADLARGQIPSEQELYYMSLYTIPYITASALYPGHTFGLMRSAQVLAYGLTDVGITGAVARTGGPVALSVVGQAAQYKIRVDHGAGLSHAMEGGGEFGVAPSLHGNWLQTGLNFNWPW